MLSSLIAFASFAGLAPTLMPQATEPGATLRLYKLESNIEELFELIPGQTPNVDRKIDRIDIPDGGFGSFAGETFKDQFMAEVTGEIQAQTAGRYTFRLTSDDGSRLTIADKVVIDHDGVHAATARTGEVDLTAGWHRFKIRYFEAGGGEELKLEWTRAGQTAFEVVGVPYVRVPANLTRVVSPGPKRVARPGGPARSGSGMPLAGLHPAWEVMTIRPDDFRPQVGGLAVRPDGKLLITTFAPNQSGQLLPNLRDGKLWLIEGADQNDRTKVKPKLLAENLQEPLGLTYMDGELYVCQRTEITRLRDTNGDDVIDKFETVGKGWIADNYHHFTFGLAAKDGSLYASLSTSITFDAPGINGPNPPFRGSVFRVDPKAYDPSKPMANVEFLSSGHRTPNGILVGPEGVIFVGENQGSWQPANKLNAIVPGGFYGHVNNVTHKNAQYPNGGVPGLFDDKPFVAPALYLPQGEIANSPSGMVMIPSGEFEGQILMADVKFGGLKRAFLEKVDGQWQGGTVQYTQGFESGMNRIAWGPDGSLYLGGIGASETWGWTDPKTGRETTFGLQRLRPTGKSTFEIKRVSATPTGFLIEFNRPVPAAALRKKDGYLVRQWRYEPTVEYGGPKVDRETLPVSRTQVSADRKSVRLTVPGLKAGRVVHLMTDPKSDQGETLWATEVWYSLNQIPKAAPAKAAPPIPVLVFSKTAAFRHDSIPSSIVDLRKMGDRVGIKFDFTEDATKFTDAALKPYRAVMFLNTTGDVLNAEQQAAFERYIRSGRGYVGVHAACDTEYDWPWYGQLVGAYFVSHPEIQQANIKLEDPTHPTVRMLPKVWSRVDEWYNYRQNPRSKVKVLATLDTNSYRGSSMKGDHPVIWCHEFDGGRSWYTNCGHRAETFREVLFQRSLEEGIRWVVAK